MRRVLQTTLRGGVRRTMDWLFPPDCLLCRAPVGTAFGLCPDCVVAAPFIAGPVCDRCGVPVLGAEGEAPACDACTTLARPWRQGRAVFRYEGVGRRIALLLKHADRQDLARAAGPWLARTARPLWQDGQVIVPVPLAFGRRLTRRYNQAALLAMALARKIGQPVIGDALRRVRATPSLDHRSLEDRFALLAGAIAPGRGATRLSQRPVLLIDDVMTTGATLASATEACITAGAARVDVLLLARVARDRPRPGDGEADPGDPLSRWA